MTTDQFLFLLDVDAIQDYIFCTNKLRTIIGASWILDDLNASDSGGTMSELMKNGSYGFGADCEAIRKNPNFIYSSGGNTKVIFSDEKPEQFEKKMHRLYGDAGVSITTHIHKFSASDKYEDILREANRAIAQKKYNHGKAFAVAAAPYFKYCELCGKAYAHNERKIYDDAYLVCSHCALKVDKSEYDCRHRLFPSCDFPRDMNKIARGMGAIVVMDGNDMGRKIKNLGSFAQLKEFSLKTEEIFRKSIETALEKFPFDDKKNGPVSRSYKNIRPLIIGGDDLCFVMDASRALEFTRCIASEVHELSKNGHTVSLFGNEGITISAGILFMKPNYPFNFAYRIANSLLHSAKQYAKAQPKTTSSLDFHVLLSSSGDEIEKTRSREYSFDAGGLEHLMTLKPYNMDEVKNLLKDAVLIRKLLGSKIKPLRQILRSGKDASMVELLKYALRMKKKKRNEYLDLLDRRAWQKRPDAGSPWQTGLLDLIELADILKGDHYGTD